MTALIQPATLDTATIEATINGILDSLPTGPDATPAQVAAQRHAALMAVAELAPATSMQAMLAAQAVAAHYAALDNFRRAAQPEVEDALAVRLRINAAAMSRLMLVALRDLRDQQSGAANHAAAPQIREAAIQSAPPAARPEVPPATPVAKAANQQPAAKAADQQPAAPAGRPATPGASVAPPPKPERHAIHAPVSAEDALAARVLAGAQHDLRQGGSLPAARAA